MRKGLNISHVNIEDMGGRDQSQVKITLKSSKKVSPFQIDVPKSHNDDITQDTFHRIRKEGEDETAAHHCWWDDVFPNLFFDDQLWAHMICGAEWLHVVD